MNINPNSKAMMVYEWRWSNTDEWFKDVMKTWCSLMASGKTWDAVMKHIWRVFSEMLICRRTEINILTSVSHTAASHFIFFCLWCWCWTFCWCVSLQVIFISSRELQSRRGSGVLHSGSAGDLITSPFKEEKPKTTHNPPLRRNSVRAARESELCKGPSMFL